MRFDCGFVFAFRVFLWSRIPRRGSDLGFFCDCLPLCGINYIVCFGLRGVETDLSEGKSFVG